jgi:hypothetical protein
MTLVATGPFAVVTTCESKLQTTATDGTEQERVTGWLKPFVGETVNGMVAEEPEFTSMEVTSEESEKSALAVGGVDWFCTVNETVTASAAE